MCHCNRMGKLIFGFNVYYFLKSSHFVRIIFLSVGWEMEINAVVSVLIFVNIKLQYDVR